MSGRSAVRDTLRNTVRYTPHRSCNVQRGRQVPSGSLRVLAAAASEWMDGMEGGVSGAPRGYLRSRARAQERRRDSSPDSIFCGLFELARRRETSKALTRGGLHPQLPREMTAEMR